MLPKEYSARKDFPLLTVLTAYFPDAIEALVELCKKGNAQHSVDANAVNPFKLDGDKVVWDRSKSTDQVNTAMRHLWDHERAKRGAGSVVDDDGILHVIKTAWRALAEAQLTIERGREDEERYLATVGNPPDPLEQTQELPTFSGFQPTGKHWSQELNDFLDGVSPYTSIGQQLDDYLDSVSPYTSDSVADAMKTGAGFLKVGFQDGKVVTERVRDPYDWLNDQLTAAAAEARGERPGEQEAELRFTPRLQFQLPLTDAVDDGPSIGDTVNFGCSCHPGEYKIIEIVDGFPLVESPDGKLRGWLTPDGVIPSYTYGGK